MIRWMVESMIEIHNKCFVKTFNRLLDGGGNGFGWMTAERLAFVATRSCRIIIFRIIDILRKEWPYSKFTNQNGYNKV